MNSPKTGNPSNPTLGDKEIREFCVTPDAARVAGMKADPMGYNEEVNGPPVSSFTTRSYAKRVRERADARKKSTILKGHAPPLGHVPPPPSDKMKALADLQSTPQPESPPFKPVPKPEAKDPTPVRGVGAAYPVNQALASGKVKGPVSLREGNEMAAQQHKLSPESVQALEMAAEAQREGEHDPRRVKNSPSIAEETRTELDDAEKEFEPEMPQIDFAAIDDIRSTLMSQKRRDSIEGRLDKLDITDMIMKGELSQTISIVPGKLNITLRTFSQAESLWILKYVYDFPGSALYVQELINTCRLVCSIVSVNDALLPDHRKDVGTPTEQVSKKDFEKKFSYIASRPVQLVADFSVQLMWFQDRVNKLLTLDELKNG